MGRLGKFFKIAVKLNLLGRGGAMINESLVRHEMFAGGPRDGLYHYHRDKIAMKDIDTMLV